MESEMEIKSKRKLIKKSLYLRWIISKHKTSKVSLDSAMDCFTFVEKIKTNNKNCRKRKYLDRQEFCNDDAWNYHKIKFKLI